MEETAALRSGGRQGGAPVVPRAREGDDDVRRDATNSKGPAASGFASRSCLEARASAAAAPATSGEHQLAIFETVGTGGGVCAVRTEVGRRLSTVSG